MDIYWLAHIKSKYPVEDHSRDPPSRLDPYLALFEFPRVPYAQVWDREKYLLAQALVPLEIQTSSLAEQVFGRQARDQKLSLLHSANLLHRRYALRQRHLADIRHRLGQLQENLSREKMLSPREASRHQRDLEKLLLNLEAERRDEETALWKDALRIRQDLLAGAKEYQALRHRSGILRDLEVDHGEGD